MMSLDSGLLFWATLYIPVPLIPRMIGGAEIARPGIARLDNSAPYRKGGHRETRFSVRVDVHYKFMFATGSII